MSPAAAVAAIVDQIPNLRVVLPEASSAGDPGRHLA